MDDFRPTEGRGHGVPSLHYPLPRRPPPGDSLSLNSHLSATSSHAPIGRQRTHSDHVQLDPPPYLQQPTKHHQKQHYSSSTSLKPALTATSSRSASAASSRYTKEGAPFQPFPSTWTAPPPSDTTHKSHQSRRRVHSSRRETAGGDTASESGISVLSAFRPTQRPQVDGDKERRRASREHTDSPLRRWARWSGQRQSVAGALGLSLALVVLIKWCISLGNYSGANTPPLRGDFEAQRHWLALTSSSLSSPFFHSPAGASSSLSLPPTAWYFHDLSYWGLDYPPLTAYHSLFLGAIARLSPHTAPFVTLRPPVNSSVAELENWEQSMVELEAGGAMKSWMRGTVVWGDLLVWASAVVVYCRVNYARGAGDKGWRPVIVSAMSILLQPALLLVDNGHFQYNSLMLGLTLWSVNFLQAGHDLLGAVAFVLSLGFKQMALYYSPAIFAYLLGKCLYLGGRPGVSLLLNLAFVTLGSFALLFAPFLTSPSHIVQALHRIFPFARGLFEDKVANVWCALNVIVKLRELASVATLAKVALFATLLVVLPSMIGLIWVSWATGEKARKSEGAQATEPSVERKSVPTIILLPHALFLSSMGFFLFSFQVHEKSILLPLMPLTLLIGGREAGFGRMDWEWSVLLNNVAVFSMWPLLKRDGLGVQYLALTLGWNYLVGYNPFHLRHSFVKYLSLGAYSAIIALHLLELVASPPAHLPDLFVLFNVALSVVVFGLGFLWASKRSVQEGWGVVGM
ncbi:ALG6, ALG8 glycosyltransferase family-domain-containing protein [Leucosporidium creatinivorum]|uniref:Alpha-1,3-glucosyltransferase n=1 Tax=Leucosporidium creatinivorum TaxID=106004 RepID=A0A1Y2D6C8_9BASI|nr:ALG6, ALG8 glycosyltransferase family-domain-containing protein [Leucosporidium creatinivorum]